MFRIKRALRRRQWRRELVQDIAEIPPEKAAQLCRTFERARVGDVEVRLALAIRGQESENPGDRAAMEKYAEVIRAGRRVKYGILRIEETWIDEPERESVPEHLEAEIESVFEEMENEDE